MLAKYGEYDIFNAGVIKIPRCDREKSKTGIYHVMLRGINKQVIFEDEEDYEVFIETLKRYKAISGYKIFAYCLMSNHLHLLIKVENEELGTVFKRIAGSYVYWYNRKYGRTGHLFQDRFKSEAVEDDRYFLTVLRYIHRNPIEVGVCKEIGEYHFSSYNEIVKGKSELVDTDYINGIIDKDGYIRFCDEKSGDECLDIGDVSRLTDADAREIIEKVSGCKNAVEFQKISSDKRGGYISELKQNGLSIRQISRLTGVSFAVARK